MKLGKMKGIKKFFKRNFWREMPWAMFLVLVVVVILRIPSLFEPYSYGDEGIYLVLGQGLRKGLVFYRDIHDNKPPFLYMMAGLAGSLAWFRAILLGWNLFNTWIVWKLGEKIFKSEKVAFWGSLLFGIGSCLTILEGNIANGEIFMIMPMSAAVWFLWEGARKKKEKYFWWVGILASIGFLFKVPILFDLMAVAFWLVVVSLAEKKVEWERLFRRIGMIMGGFLVLNVLFFVYYGLKGAAEPYLRSALMQNIGYLSSWGGQEQTTGGLPTGLLMRVVLGGILALLLIKFRKKLGNGLVLLGLWFVGGMFGALLSERPYPHYLMEVIPPLALMGGVVLGGEEKVKKVGLKILVIGLILFWLAWREYEFWEYPVGKYYKNYLAYARGEKTESEYFSYWGEGVLANYRIANLVRAQTGEKDRIFVWGTEPAVYYLSNRLPVGRYTVAYHVKDFNGYEETMEAIKREEPKVMLKLKSENGEFGEFFDYLYKNYELEKEDGDWELWRRMGL
jgi:hypothetical protein